MSVRADVVAVMLAAAFVAAPAAAQTIGHSAEPVATGLEHPWSLAFLPDGRMLVTERPGRLRVIENGRLREAPVEGVPEVFASGQAGLFEVAPAPDFAESGTLFLSFACGTSDENNTCLARGRFDGQRLHDVRTIFTAQPLKRGNAHYGGRIAFLPDGTLVLTLGDAFDRREDAQNPANHLGTIVRLTPDGTAAPDNPFVGRSGHAPEVLTYGNRNVQGLVYDAERGELYAHEHGPRGGDEINLIQPGANYGWPVASFGLDYTGAQVTPFHTYPGMVMPMHHWSPSIAPSGFAVYRGEPFSQWDGDFLVGALMKPRGVHRLRLTDGVFELQEVLLSHLDERVRDVRVGPDGAVYVVTDHESNGQVMRVVPTR